jgi:hypothetical protein
MKKTRKAAGSPLKVLRLEDLKLMTGGEDEASLALSESGFKEKECKAGTNDEKTCKQITRPK